MKPIKKISFFIGSGSSLPSGQPSVDDITKACLEDEIYLIEPIDLSHAFQLELDDCLPQWGTKKDFEKKSGGRKTKKDLKPWRDPAISIQRFLKEMVLLEDWSKPPNYEDISGILNLMINHFYLRQNNPFVVSFIQKHNIATLLENIDFPSHHRFHKYPIGKKLLLIDDFIGWVVSSRLKSKPKLLGYESLVNAIKELSAKEVQLDFITTNYDLNLELLFQKHKLSFTDGFVGEVVEDDIDQEWRIGNKFQFFTEKAIQLIKLHGSINWFALKDVHTIAGNTLGVVSDFKIEPSSAFCSTIQEIGPLYTPEHGPEMLRGNLSKAHEYSYTIFSQLLNAFVYALNTSRLLVISGYGWSDEPLNARLLSFAGRDENKIIIFDGNIDKPAIRNIIDYGAINNKLIGDLNEDKPIVIYPSFVSDLKERELLEVIEKVMPSIQ